MSSSLSFASVILLVGLALTAIAQIGITLHGFSTDPLQGLLCLFVPFYVYIYARRYKANPWLMRGWYLGIVLFIAGAMLNS